jgi:hypothetical protein
MRSRIERTRHSQDDVKIGLGGDGELARCGAKSRYVGAHQRTIQRQGLAATALQTKCNFHMPASDLFLKQTPKLHLDGVGSGRQPKMQIEKTVVHRFQGK